MAPAENRDYLRIPRPLQIKVIFKREDPKI